jgi:hypothetical protein
MAIPGAAVPGAVVPSGSLTAPGGAQGLAGVPGAPGFVGTPSWTTVGGAGFTVPAYGASITITVPDSTWAALGEWIYIDDAGGPGVAGQLVVTAKTATSLTLFNPNPNLMPLASTTVDGLLRKVSGNSTDFVDGTNNSQPLSPVIWYARLQSYNAIGNPNFEVDQRNAGAAVLNVSTQFAQDRWQIARSGAMGINTQQAGLGIAVGQGVSVPGTNFVISQNCLRISVNTAQASMGAGDYLILQQPVEGIYWRELMGDVHSIQMLVRSSVAGLRFGVALNDSGTTLRSLTKLSPALSANAWTLVQFPNLPVWPSGGNFNSAIGSTSYYLRIVLACGSTNMSTVNDVWQNANVLGALGMSNFAATLNAAFDIAFVQHEPGPFCTTPIDKPFFQNLNECLRYYQKTLPYNLAFPNTTTRYVSIGQQLANSSTVRSFILFNPEMAKAPVLRVTGYQTASYNSLYLDSSAGNANYTISALSNVDTRGTTGGFTVSGSGSVSTIPSNALGNWEADTGW